MSSPNAIVIEVRTTDLQPVVQPIGAETSTTVEVVIPVLDATYRAILAAIQDQIADLPLSAISGLVEALASKATPTDISAAISSLTAGSPQELDTFLEAYNRFLSNESALSAVNAQLAQKATITALNALADVVAQKASASALSTHVTDTSNPHGVTKVQVGLGNVPNLAAADLPVSTAQAAAIGALQVPMGQCRLAYTSATALTLTRFGGGRVFINGAYVTIPAGGVTLSNAGLTAATLYYVYAYLNGTTLTLEASTTGHAPSATHGHETKTGDATRTLVGMVYTDAGSPGTFADSLTKRLVASWHNRRPREVYVPQNGQSTTSTAFVEVSTGMRASFLTWGDEAIDLGAVGVASNLETQRATNAIVGIDGTPTGAQSAATSISAGAAIAISSRTVTTPVEGYHYATVMGKVSGGTGFFYADLTGLVRA